MDYQCTGIWNAQSYKPSISIIECSVSVVCKHLAKSYNETRFDLVSSMVGRSKP